jgi:uncharacterized damage-inducible protein DinB
VNSTLRDLTFHQAWADAEHWRAFEAHPAALGDGKLLERLHHIHQVQRMFLWAVEGPSGEPVPPTRFHDFASPAALKEYARDYHLRALPLLEKLGEERLAEPVDLPWFKDPSFRLTAQEALVQAAMHSHYHRGQNAVRLRELGGQPPLTDLIVWIAKGRPEARWS